MYSALPGQVVYNFLIILMIIMGLVSFGFAAFGRGISRGLLMANGLFVSLLWWLLAGLGA